MNFDESVLKVVFSIVENLILPIIASFISIRLYKYWLKDRYKSRLIKNHEIYFLETMFMMYTIIPIAIAPFIYDFMSENKNISFNYINIFIIVIIFVIVICAIYSPLKKTRKGFKMKFVLSLIFPTAPTILGTWMLTLIYISFFEQILKQPNGEKLIKINIIKEYLIMYLSIYLMVSFVFFPLYYYKRDRSKLGANRVDLFYLENNEIIAKYNLKYNDFNIDKEFISFYCNERNKITVIPRANFIKIEYYYDKSTK